MREIKFRAWDSELKRMIDFSNSKDGIQYCCGEMEVSSGWDMYADPTYEQEYGDRMKIMQYTGLKDKNGVEIYEGDIVSLCEVWDRGDGFYDDALAVVEWCKEFNAYRTKEIGQDDWFYLCDHDLIVIGNIYENPELIEQ